MKLVLRPNVWYTSDGRPLHGLAEQRSGKISTAAKLKGFRHTPDGVNNNNNNNHHHHHPD